MNKTKGYITRIGAWMKSPRGKKTMYIALVLILVVWVLFRFAMIGMERRIDVFNPARAAMTDGVPVTAIEMHRTAGVIREPLTVKNNRAFVSGTRARMLRAGQKIGTGKIVSVASNIDLDTGMHAVQTSGVADGLQDAEFNVTGFFVPVDAVDNGTVYVVRDGRAAAVPVHVARSDDAMAYIDSGLADGDVVITSRVSDGVPVQVKK
ncbi:hypothetical protein HDR66_03210 [bacterium]|nr:hypothetical protein [bacterium]